MILNKKILRRDYLVSVCDEELIDRIIKDDDTEIDVSRKFYGEKRVSEEEVITELKKATIINVIGLKSVQALKKVKKTINIIMINEVPHAQWIRIF